MKCAACGKVVRKTQIAVVLYPQATERRRVCARCADLGVLVTAAFLPAPAAPPPLEALEALRAELRRHVRMFDGFAKGARVTEKSVLAEGVGPARAEAVAHWNARAEAFEGAAKALRDLIERT